MSKHYLTATETTEHQPLSLKNRFASLYSTLFMRNTNNTDERVSAALNQQQIANKMDTLQPSLAAELRAFAARA